MRVTNYYNILKKGIDYWNDWKGKNRHLHPFLPGLNVFELAKHWKVRIDENGLADGTFKINFRNVDFHNCDLEAANFSNADLSGTSFYEADLTRATIENSMLRSCLMRKSILSIVSLKGSTLRDCNLNRAVMVRVALEDARLINCIVYGISSWDITMNEKTVQRNLIIEDINSSWGNYYGSEDIETDVPVSSQQYLAVDDLDVAQFIYLLTKHENLRKSINAINDKGVLLLGRFKDRGLEFLNALADQFRSKKFLPIIFDFERPDMLDMMGTITVVAGLSRYVIVDLSGPSVPAEIERITRNYDKAIITYSKESEVDRIYGMFKSILGQKNIFYFKYKETDELNNKLELQLKNADRYYHDQQIEQHSEALRKLENG